MIALDLGNTLAELDEGIKEENSELLKQLEKNGNKLAIMSGKPTYYLSNFLRPVGLKTPILVGENSTVIQIGIDLYPEHYIIPYTDDA